MPQLKLTHYGSRGGAPCQVPGCERTTDGYSNLCNRCKRRALRSGSPTALAVRKSELRFVNKEVKKFLKTNRGHPTLQKTYARINEIITFYADLGARFVANNRKPTTYTQRLAREMHRLKAGGCTGEEVFEIAATLYRFTTHDPRRLPRYSREHYFNLSRMIFSLRARYTKSSVSPTTGRAYVYPDRLSSELLLKFGTYISVELATSLHAMEQAMDFHKRREAQFKQDLRSTIASHPFTAHV